MPLNTIVISLTEARRRPLIEQLKKSPNLVTHLQHGVLGSEIWKNESIIDAASFEYINDRPMTSGEAGAAYAHFLVYQSIVKNNWPWALIFEDNARILIGTEDYVLTLIDGIATHPKYSSSPVLIHLNHENAKFVSSRIVLNNGMEIYEPFTILRTSKAYLMNLSAARIAVLDGLPLKDLPDWPHWIHSVKYLVSIKDLVVIDRSGGSEIGIRPQARRDRIMWVWQKRFLKCLTLFKFVFGLEAINYRKKTGLNDYVAWIVMDRFFRICGKWMGKLDIDNSRVVIIESRFIQMLKERVSNSQLKKKTSKSIR